MNNNNLHHFRIKGTTPAGFDTEVLMDNKPLKGVTFINLDMRIDRTNRVIIEFIPEKVDLEVDATVAALQEEGIFNAEKKKAEIKMVKDFDAGD